VNRPIAVYSPLRPDAHRRIHAAPCAHCPSARGASAGHEHDPEVLDILTWPRQQQLETVFVCAWRPEALCRGYCDTLGVEVADLPVVP